VPGSNTEVPGSKLRPQADSMRLTPISSTIIIAAKLRFIAGSICMKLVSCYATEAPQWIVIHRDAPGAARMVTQPHMRPHHLRPHQTGHELV
jgi:hypothetical protein